MATKPKGWGELTARASKSKVPLYDAVLGIGPNPLTKWAKPKKSRRKKVKVWEDYLQSLECAADLVNDMKYGDMPPALEFAERVEETIHELEQFAEWNEGPRE